MGIEKAGHLFLSRQRLQHFCVLHKTKLAWIGYFAEDRVHLFRLPVGGGLVTAEPRRVLGPWHFNSANDFFYANHPRPSVCL